MNLFFQILIAQLFCSGLELFYCLNMSEFETKVNNSGCGMFNKFKLDRDFAEKLRISSPNQYNCLVTMHLSFLLDLNSTDE